MANSAGFEEYMDTDPALVELIPSDLWSLPYLRLPGILMAATRVNPVRVGEVCAASETLSPKITPLPSTSSTAASLPVLRVSAPTITQSDGQASTLRAFCSQLVNQINSSLDQFPTEVTKVQFAYQCLGPGALLKMRSLFRCLEDSSIPREIETLNDFLLALKQRCQDPGLCERATRTIETLYQRSMNFHGFITIFEDNMTDSIYGSLEKANWKVMLERRLSTRLRNALVTAHNVPSEYHSFVAYLRQKDAAFQEINYRATLSERSVPAKMVYPFTAPSTTELTVSQGGSAMDLDMLSREKGPDGRLTPQARNARRSLGRCYRCNQGGHLAINCPLGNSPRISVSSDEISLPPESKQLKDQLQ